jgi:hypothetical protein
MALLVVMPEADIPEFLRSGSAIVVIMAREVLDQQHVTEDEMADALEDYTCGAEADVWVDVVCSPEHYVFQHLEEVREGKQEEDAQ